MRILHVGSGFRPLRRGGLVAYTEDLMAEQVARGDEVDYFFAGRYYPFVKGPRLRRWTRDGVAMLEVLSSPLFDHGRQPALELGEPRLQRMFERVLSETRPDVIHFHELAGLPFSLLDAASASGKPSVLTLQDYFPLCPTFKLLDSNGEVCLRKEIGVDCMATTAAEPSDPGLLFEASLYHDIVRLPVVRRYRSARNDRLILGLSRRLAARTAQRRRGPAADAAAFQRRRDLNVERMNRTSRVIAMSERVREIYEELGVAPELLTTLQLTLAHIERLRPHQAGQGRPLTFATLGGLASAPKGARLLLDAMRSLGDEVTAGQLRLVAFGYAPPELEAEAREVPGIDVHTLYGAEDLDALLDGVDVGIMPSIWEEAYGYVGVEFLAKGIPVISNEIGGMVEYTREGETGWLNHSCSAGELASIMRRLATDPGQVSELSAKLAAKRGDVIKPMADHGAEIDAIYRELTA